MKGLRFPIVTILVLLLVVSVTAAFGENNNGFIHAVVIDVDGEDYYMSGTPDGENGAFDIPDHERVVLGKNKLVGKHYNRTFWSTIVVG